MSRRMPRDGVDIVSGSSAAHSKSIAALRQIKAIAGERRNSGRWACEVFILARDTLDALGDNEPAPQRAANAVYAKP